MSTPEHQPFYCEENIWKLAQARNHPDAQVIIISNTRKRVLVAHQKAVPENELVLWDYHVIYREAEACYDLDSRLPYPCKLKDYLEESFVPDHSDFLPSFRTVDAADYCKDFYSDRMHMQCDGKWLKPPPPWPCIRDGSIPLSAYIDMSNPAPGPVYNYTEFKLLISD